MNPWRIICNKDNKITSDICGKGSTCSGGSRISRRGRGPRWGARGHPRRLRFENFVFQNERIWTLGGRAPGTPPLDPPMTCTS